MALRKKQQWNGDDRRAAPLVLLAGTHPGSNELLSRVLDAKGYRTMVAQTVEAALGRVADHLPRAAVLDLSSGGVGANMQVLDAIRQHDDDRVRGCRVVVLGRSAANRNFAFQSGADGFLLRPFHANDLVTVLAEVLALAPDDRAKHRREMLKLGT